MRDHVFGCLCTAVPVPVLSQRTDKGYESSKGRTHIQSDLAVAHQRALGIFSIHVELCDNYNTFSPIALLQSSCSICLIFNARSERVDLLPVRRQRVSSCSVSRHCIAHSCPVKTPSQQAKPASREWRRLARQRLGIKPVTPL